jgi:hypothetical protein
MESSALRASTAAENPPCLAWEVCGVTDEDARQYSFGLHCSYFASHPCPLNSARPTSHNSQNHGAKKDIVESLITAATFETPDNSVCCLVNREIHQLRVAGLPHGQPKKPVKSIHIARGIREGPDHFLRVPSSWKTRCHDI